MACIPFFFVSYFAMFDAIFAVWVLPLSRRKSRLDFLKNPLLLNALCWLVPIVVLVVALVLNTRLWLMADITKGDGRLMEAMLEKAAAAWDKGGLGAVNTMGLLTENETTTCATRASLVTSH